MTLRLQSETKSRPGPRASRLAIRLAALAIVAVAVAAPAALLAPSEASAQDKSKDGDKDKDAADEDGKEGQGDTPAAPPAEPPADESASPGGSLDVDALRQEYLRLRDQLFQSRARAASVARALYSTKLRIDLRYASGRFYSITRATIRLDGANVYDDTSGAIAKDRAPRFEGFVAPGRHRINVRIEATGKDDERFSSVVDNTFTIQAPGARDVTVSIVAKDEGDIPFEWKKKQQGTYKLDLDVAVRTAKRAGGAGSGAKDGDGNKAAPRDKKPAKKKAQTIQPTAPRTARSAARRDANGR